MTSAFIVYSNLANLFIIGKIKATDIAQSIRNH